MILHRISEASAGDVPQGVHFVFPGADGVIPVFLHKDSVPGDGQKPSEGVIGVSEDRGDPGGGFGFFLYPAVGIPGGDPPESGRWDTAL